MTAADVHICHDIDPRVKQHRTELTTQLRREILTALDLPGTAAEIRDRLGTHLYRPTHYYGVGCRGHLSDEVWCAPWLQSTVQRELVRLERHGVVDRLVLPSVKAHLWWRR